MLRLNFTARDLLVVAVLAIGCTLYFQAAVVAHDEQANDSEGVLLEEAAVDYRATAETETTGMYENIQEEASNSNALSIFLTLAVLAGGYYAWLASKNESSSV